MITARYRPKKHHLDIISMKENDNPFGKPESLNEAFVHDNTPPATTENIVTNQGPKAP
jgi:hypothetical protein